VGPRERVTETARVLDVLEVRARHACLGILHDLGQDLGGLHVGLVAGAHPVVEAEAGRARHLVEHARHGSALAHHRDRPGRERAVEEGRREGGHQTRGQVGESLAVGADDAQPGPLGQGTQARLGHPPGLTHLGEATAEHDGGPDALGRGGLERLEHALGRHHHHREIDLARDRGHRGEGGEALHGGA
jgi:hypothetical protein